MCPNTITRKKTFKMNNKLFTYPLIIKESYLDTFGHVNNATYLTLLEEARWDIITKNGYGLKKIEETGLGPTILKITISFSKELLLNDKITIHTQIISYDGKIARLSHKILRDNKLCCEAEIVMALFDLSKRKLVLPTAEWLHALGVSAN